MAAENEINEWKDYSISDRIFLAKYNSLTPEQKTLFLKELDRLTEKDRLSRELTQQENEAPV